MEMVEVAEKLYWEISWQTMGFSECEPFWGKKTLCSPASLVSGVSSLLYVIFTECIYVWLNCNVCWKQTLWIPREN